MYNKQLKINLEVLLSKIDRNKLAKLVEEPSAVSTAKCIPLYKITLLVCLLVYYWTKPGKNRHHDIGMNSKPVMSKY